MNCRQAHRQLAAARKPDATTRHVEACGACSQFAARLESARRLFREHQSEFAPDAGFAARVGRQLEGDSRISLNWAVARVLPVTLALLAVLVWVSWSAPDSSYESASPTDDLLGWIIDGEGVAH